MTNPLTQVLSSMNEISSLLSGYQNNLWTQLRNDLERFEKMTNDLSNQQRWQAWSTLCLTGLGASLAVTGTLITKGDPAKIPADIWEKLRDNEFLRQTCETSSKLFNGLQAPVDSFYRSHATGLEARRQNLQQIVISGIQSARGQLSSCSQEVNMAASRLLEAKARGA
ncbi:MAG: hypothetical protein JSS61_04035 [Verrucomicrobia bacterium]|nr:hypothetical protein [Verrucomicrobiota bacterium]